MRNKNKNTKQNSFLTRQDLFGYHVYKNLNLNRGHREHRTMLGGCCSILFRILVLAFVLSRILLFYTGTKDVIRKTQVATDQGIISKLVEDDTKAKLMVQLKMAQDGELVPLDVTQEQIWKYVNVQFQKIGTGEMEDENGQEGKQKIPLEVQKVPDNALSRTSEE